MINKVLIRKSPGVFEEFTVDDYNSLFRLNMKMPELAGQSVDFLVFVESAGDCKVNGEDVKCHRVHFDASGVVDNKKNTERLHIISELVIARGYGISRKAEPSLEEVELRQKLRTRHGFLLSKKDYMVLEAS